MDLKTKYMGVELKNPVIVGASNLVTDIPTLKKIEEEGASAVVYKTLFEEQIHLENLQNHHAEENYADRHAEMAGSLLGSFNEEAGPEIYLSKLKEAVETLDIPVFGSLNCVYDETWEEYAKKIEDTGAAGLELNFYAIRLVTTQQHEYPSLWAALVSISDKLGCTPETLRAWVKKSQAQPSKPSSNTQSTEERLAVLERENKELKRTNDILRQAAAFFAQAELDRKQK